MMQKDCCILVVDDNAAVLKAVEMLLTPCFGKVVALSDPNRIPFALQAEKPDAVLLDMNFKTGINNGNEGLFWLREIKKRNEAVQVFNTAGQCIYNGFSTRIPAPHSGVYIVKVGTRSYKIIIR